MKLDIGTATNHVEPWKLYPLVTILQDLKAEMDDIKDDLQEFGVFDLKHVPYLDINLNRQLVSKSITSDDELNNGLEEFINNFFHTLDL